MIITRAPSFKKDFKRIDEKLKQLVEQKLQLLVLSNGQHPSLRLKKIRKSIVLWEMSVTMNYRIILTVRGNHYTLYRIGTHDIINRI